jgi:hypothetical protein
MIKTIGQVCNSLVRPERCGGLTREGSEADGPDVAGGVVTVAPIHF